MKSIFNFYGGRDNRPRFLFKSASWSCFSITNWISYPLIFAIQSLMAADISGVEESIVGHGHQNLRGLEHGFIFWGTGRRTSSFSRNIYRLNGLNLEKNTVAEGHLRSFPLPLETIDERRRKF